MPNRIYLGPRRILSGHRAGKSTSVPLAVKRRLWGLPCAVCGCAGDTVVDHVTPIAKGGTDDESNLQPLCRACNAKKGKSLTNAQLLEWVRSRGEFHYQRHRYELATRHINPFDAPSFAAWLAGMRCA